MLQAVGTTVLAGYVYMVNASIGAMRCIIHVSVCM